MDFIFVHAHRLKLLAGRIQETVFIIDVSKNKADARVVTLPTFVFFVCDYFVEPFASNVGWLVVHNDNNGGTAIWRAYIKIWVVFGELFETVNLGLSEDVGVDRQARRKSGVAIGDDKAVFDEFSRGSVIIVEWVDY